KVRTAVTRRETDGTNSLPGELEYLSNNVVAAAARFDIVTAETRRRTARLRSSLLVPRRTTADVARLTADTFVPAAPSNKRTVHPRALYEHFSLGTAATAFAKRHFSIIAPHFSV